MTNEGLVNLFSGKDFLCQSLATVGTQNPAGMLPKKSHLRLDAQGQYMVN
jgi:hypothetical protein